MEVANIIMEAANIIGNLNIAGGANVTLQNVHLNPGSHITVGVGATLVLAADFEANNPGVEIVLQEGAVVTYMIGEAAGAGFGAGM
jgi:hypothetical protein